MHGMISFCTCWVQVNIKLFMFTYFRERETQHEQGRGRERGRHRIRSRPQALSCQHRVRHRAQTHKPWDDDLSWSQMLNWLSPPATHFNEVLNDTVQRALATWQTQRERKKCEETGSGKSRLLSFTVIWLWRVFVHWVKWAQHICLPFTTADSGPLGAKTLSDQWAGILLGLPRWDLLFQGLAVIFYFHNSVIITSFNSALQDM